MWRDDSFYDDEKFSLAGKVKGMMRGDFANCTYPSLFFNVFYNLIIPLSIYGFSYTGVTILGVTSYLLD